MGSSQLVVRDNIYINIEYVAFGVWRGTTACFPWSLISLKISRTVLKNYYSNNQ